MASNSNIGQPCYIDAKWWQIVAFFFLFPLLNLPKSFVQQSKYNFVQNILLYSWHGCFSCSHKTPFPFYQMWHISNYFCLFHMLFKHVQFRTQNNLLSLHSQTHNAFHIVDLSKITLEHFCPWKLCSLDVFKLAKDIKVFLKFLWQWFVFFICQNLNLRQVGCNRGNESQ